MLKYINETAHIIDCGLKPFRYCIFDDFFKDGIAEKLAAEFPDYESDKWLYYNNPYCFSS